MFKNVVVPIFLVWAIVASAIIPSCHKPETGPNAGLSEIEIGKSVVVEGRSFQIVTIDSCEYVAYSIGANFGLLTHKGNCKNKAHCR